MSALLDAVELEFEDKPSVEEAVFNWKDSAAEFADCLISARHRTLGCRATAAFDSKALKLAGFKRKVGAGGEVQRCAECKVRDGELFAGHEGFAFELPVQHSCGPMERFLGLVEGRTIGFVDSEKRGLDETLNNEWRFACLRSEQWRGGVV